MTRDLRDVALGAGFAFVAGLVLWPPGAVYWTRVAAVVGDAAALTAVVVLAAVLGAAFAAATGVRFRPFAVGGTLAYAVGMAAIEVLRAPDSPVHLLWYGVLLAALLGGGLAAGLRDGRGVVRPDVLR